MCMPGSYSVVQISPELLKNYFVIIVVVVVIIIIFYIYLETELAGNLLSVPGWH